MRDSSTHPVSKPASFSGGIKKAAPFVLLTWMLQGLFSDASDALKPDDIANFTDYLRDKAASLSDTAADLTPNVLAGPIERACFPEREPSRSLTGMDSNIERVLARTAATVVRRLFANWESLHADHRVRGQEQWDLEALDDACRRFLENRGATVPPEIIKQWLADLEKSKFLEKPELGAAPWNTQPTQKAPENPCKFADYFQWAYPTVFQSAFREQLSEDEMARSEFGIVIGGRILDFAVSHANQLGELKEQFEKIGQELRFRTGAFFKALNRGFQRGEKATRDEGEKTRAQGAEILKEIRGLKSGSPGNRKSQQRAEEQLLRITGNIEGQINVFKGRMTRALKRLNEMKEPLRVADEKLTAAKATCEKCEREFLKLDAQRTELEAESEKCEDEIGRLEDLMNSEKLSKTPRHANKRRK